MGNNPFDDYEKLEAAYKKLDRKEVREFLKRDLEVMIEANKAQKHDISKKVIKNLTPVMKAQDNFGMNKYGEPLRSSYRYGWLDMAKEEIADMLKYLECEQERKETITDLIREAIDADDVFSKNVFLLEALDLLTIEGTGK